LGIRAPPTSQLAALGVSIELPPKLTA